MHTASDPSAGPIADRAARLGRLRYRAAHRGFLEADLILGPFAQRHGADLDPAELDAFEVLLDQPDHDIYAWIMGMAETPQVYDTSVMTRLRGFRHQAHAARLDLNARAVAGEAVVAGGGASPGAPTGV